MTDFLAAARRCNKFAIERGTPDEPDDVSIFLRDVVTILREAHDQQNTLERLKGLMAERNRLEAELVELRRTYWSPQDLKNFFRPW
jgi:hypothetical protein